MTTELIDPDDAEGSPTERLEAQENAIRHMRRVATERAENTSLRSVAREIGMSPSGLKKFLDGAAPYRPTLRRLRRWFVQYGSMRTGEVQAEDASAALAVLLHDLPSPAQDESTRLILEGLSRGYERSGKPRPEWLTEMLADLGSSGGNTDA